MIQMTSCPVYGRLITIGYDGLFGLLSLLAGMNHVLRAFGQCLRLLNDLNRALSAVKRQRGIRVANFGRTQANGPLVTGNRNHSIFKLKNLIGFAEFQLTSSSDSAYLISGRFLAVQALFSPMEKQKLLNGCLTILGSGATIFDSK